MCLDGSKWVLTSGGRRERRWAAGSGVRGSAVRVVGEAWGAWLRIRQEGGGRVTCYGGENLCGENEGQKPRLRRCIQRVLRKAFKFFYIC